MKRIQFVFFDAGGGHRSAATALKSVIEEQGRDWQVELVNLQEVLEPLDIFRKYAGIRMEDVYNTLLKRGWTLGSEYLVPVMHGIIRVYHPRSVAPSRNIGGGNRPDLVVSVIPNFNRALFQGLARRRSRHSARHHPHRPRRLPAAFLDGAAGPVHRLRLREGAANRRGGWDTGRRRILAASGMILRPEFYREFTHDRGAERRAPGPRPGPCRPAWCCSAGRALRSWRTSSSASTPSSRPLATDPDLRPQREARGQVCADCRSRMPKHVVGFTREVPYFMSLADFFIGKPGPGSISEAVAMKLPVIVERNAWTLPQERYNCDWVRERQVGLVLRGFRANRSSRRELARAVGPRRLSNPSRRHPQPGRLRNPRHARQDSSRESTRIHAN